MTRKLIIATRNDGFGTRMLGFLNAQYLAEVFMQDFGFVWPELNEGEGFHVVPKPADVFAADYLRRFLVQDIDTAALPVIERHDLTRETVEALLQHNDRICVTAYVTEKAAWRGAPTPDCPRLWKAIEWSPRLRHVLDAAESSVPEGAVGVHIRRGDLVYGPSRVRLFQQKYAPLAWCRNTIATELAAGHPVVAFCDDPMVVENFRRHFPELRFADAINDYSRFERDVFELASLAHCARIVGRASGFSILAALIGGTKRENFVAPRGNAKALIVGDIAAFPEDYPPLGEARDLSWIAIEAADELTLGERDELLARAAELDPTNVAYSYLRAATMARERRSDDAEAIVARMTELSHYFQEPLDLAGMRGRPILDFPRPSPETHPHLAAFHLLQNRKLHSPEERRSILAKSLSAKPQNAALLGTYADELSEQGAFRDAADRLRVAFAAGQSEPRLHARMSRLALRLSDFESAVEHGRRALKFDPDDDTTRLGVAEALAATNQTEEAKSLARAIEPARILDPGGIARLVKLLGALGERDRAALAERSWTERPLSVSDPRATRARHSDKKRSFAEKLFRAVRKRLKRFLPA